LPPAVPPKFRVIAVESAAELERQVNEVLNAGLMLEANTTQLHTVAGVVVISQACQRDPQWDKRVRTRESTQRVIDAGGQA
jgi:hypothetical protein